MQNTCVGTILQRHVILSGNPCVDVVYVAGDCTHTLSLSCSRRSERKWHPHTVLQQNSHKSHLFLLISPLLSSSSAGRFGSHRPFCLNLNLSPPHSRFPFCRQRKRDSVNHLLKVTSHFRIFSVWNFRASIFSFESFRFVDTSAIDVMMAMVLDAFCYQDHRSTHSYPPSYSRGTFNDGSFYIVFSSSSLFFSLVARCQCWRCCC